MGRKSNKQKALEAEAKKQEMLHSKVRSDGVGEDPIIKEVLSDNFVNAKDAQATEVALLLQQLLNGQNSVLSRLDEYGDELVKLRGRMNAYDEAREKYESNKDKFNQDVFDKAEGLKVTGEQKDKLIAKASQQLQREIVEAKANVGSRRRQLEQMLAMEPKETIVSAGKIVTVIEGGGLTNKIMNEEIRLGHLDYILPAGKPIAVPKTIAKLFYRRRKMEDEQNERKALLAKNLESPELQKGWKDIDKKYGVGTDVSSVPVYDGG